MRLNKLGATYNVFSGEELLESSIISIRSQVDYINVVWQEYSWTGNVCDENLEKLLIDLKNKGLIDKIIKYENKPPYNEKLTFKSRRKKINTGIKDLKKAKCTHAILIDVDEFYREDEFRKAKEFVYKKNITHSVCGIYDYRISPRYRMQDARDYCVGFIFKLTPFSILLSKNNMPCKIDPFRTFPYIPLLHKFYYLNMISMHHMTGIRNSYENKIKNAMSNNRPEMKEHLKNMLEMQNQMEEMDEEQILKEGYIKVKDEFKILEKWKNI